MKVLGYQLAQGSVLALPELPKCQSSEDPLIVVVGAGRGCVLKSFDSVCGIWIPLRGRLQCTSGTSEMNLLPGELRITEAETGVHANGRGNALWVAILGRRPAWQHALAGISEIPVADPALLPALHPADRTARRRATALVRSFANATQDIAMEAMLDHLAGLQQELATAIARCPGRSYSQRRQVFLRLQRVRNYLAANCHLDVDNEALARMASYSPWHFIRAFRCAYQQTPHAYLVDQRLRRARRMLRASPLTIAEIAMASGFENRCAFSRLFRQRFGTTAGAIRRELAENSARQFVA